VINVGTIFGAEPERLDQMRFTMRQVRRRIIVYSYWMGSWWLGLTSLVTGHSMFVLQVCGHEQWRMVYAAIPFTASAKCEYFIHGAQNYLVNYSVEIKTSKGWYAGGAVWYLDAGVMTNGQKHRIR
jgi:hypothetical protein